MVAAHPVYFECSRLTNSAHSRFSGVELRCHRDWVAGNPVLYSVFVFRIRTYGDNCIFCSTLLTDDAPFVFAPRKMANRFPIPF